MTANKTLEYMPTQVLLVSSANKEKNAISQTPLCAWTAGVSKI